MTDSTEIDAGLGQAALKRYADFYASLSPDSLPRLAELVTPDVHFRDPFNDLRGSGAYIRVFEHMFATITAPRFTILHCAIAGITGYIKWRFDGSLRGRNFKIVGMSEIKFDVHGMVAEHIDHWDAASQFYEQVPILGTLMRLIKRSIATK
jgi:steroid Delta-isomerase